MLAPRSPRTLHRLTPYLYLLPAARCEFTAAELGRTSKLSRAIRGSVVLARTPQYGDLHIPHSATQYRPRFGNRSCAQPAPPRRRVITHDILYAGGPADCGGSYCRVVDLQYQLWACQLSIGTDWPFASRLAYRF